MPLFDTLASLSRTPASNAADGSSDAPSTIDDQLNLLASFIALVRDGAGLTLPAGTRNKVINGNFAINQRGVSGAVVLAAGAYGHDRWKAGSAGCSYTYAVDGEDIVITITAGTLMQVIEGANIEGGAYSLAWEGTATGRINGGTLSTSGVIASGVTAAADLPIEFATGTIGKVQVLPGSDTGVFERRPNDVELLRCKRYYQTVAVGYQAPVTASGIYGGTIQLPVDMRVAPTAVWITDNGNTNFPLNGLFLTVVGSSWINFSKIATATANGFYASSVACSAEL